ncbi:hypothetical protein RND81_06G020300 [Saponaria officinalis]|uniref:Protein CPR-5 n=1 Tax=Saponaria officinalis TaxID=3572 RepID=A0AAW1K529_SAPOF
MGFHHDQISGTAADDADAPPIAAFNHHRPFNGHQTTADDQPQINGLKPSRRIKKKRISDDATSATSCSSITNPNFNNNHTNSSIQRGIRVSNKRKLNFRRNRSDVEAIAFPLGMSIAAVFAQVLERKDLMSHNTSVDYLSTICASAVRESLTNVFGEKFDAFAMNFEKSFGSTLSTIRLIRNSEIDSGKNQVGNSKVSNCHPDKIPDISSVKGACSSRSDDITEHCAESVNHAVGAVQNFEANDQTEDRVALCDQELPMQGPVSWQLARSNTSNFSNVLSTIEKSVSEQTRANELKSMEIGLIMRKLKLKETQLALDSDSNFLERCKLSLGVSRTSFKMEKFKTQLEETKHGELLKTCADFLVTGIIIMSCCLCCGVYAFSYDNLCQLTKSCHPFEATKSWWKPMASFNSGLQTLSCLFQVYSRMIFGGLMIGSIAVLLVQRSHMASQGMPITLILLLLGVLCGFVGKICVDTLGGDGYIWVIFWEVLCMVHFFAIIFNSILYSVLYGAVQVCEGMKYGTIFPFWIRRMFFQLFLVLLPVCCGLLPFASASTWWEDHISVWIRNRWFAAFAKPYDHHE